MANFFQTLINNIQKNANTTYNQNASNPNASVGTAKKETKVDTKKKYNQNISNAIQAMGEVQTTQDTTAHDNLVNSIEKLNSLVDTSNNKKNNKELLDEVNNKIKTTTNKAQLNNLNTQKSRLEARINQEQEGVLKTGDEIYDTGKLKEQNEYLKKYQSNNNNVGFNFAGVNLNGNQVNSMVNDTINKNEEKIELAKQKDDATNSYEALVKDGQELNQEEATNALNIFSQMNDIAKTQDELNAQHKNGVLDDATYSSQSMLNANKYNELAKQVEGVEYKKGYELYDAIKDSNSELYNEMTNTLSHYDDNTVQRLGNELSATVNDFTNLGNEMMAIDYTALTGKKESNFSVLADRENEETNQLRMYALSGATEMQQMTTEVVGSMMPQFIATAIAVATGNVVGMAGIALDTGTMVTGILGVQSGVNDAYEMLQKGYTVEESILHGSMYGAISFAVEQIGADGFVDMFTGDFGQGLFGNLLHNKFLNYSAVLKTLGKQATSEAIEEIVEGLSDDVANAMFNAITASNEATDLLDLDSDAWKQLMKEGVYAGLGALMMGTGSIGKVQINTYADYKNTVNLINEADRELNSNELSLEDSQKMLAVRNALASATEGFENNSLLMKSVNELTQEQTDESAKNVSLNTLAMADRYDIQRATAQQLINKMKKEGLANALEFRGIKANENSGKTIEDIFIGANQKQRQEMLNVAKYVDYINRNSDGKIDISFDDNMTTQVVDENGNVKSMKVSGNEQNGKIVLNAQTDKLQTTVLAHELTHVLENSPEYSNVVEHINNLLASGEYNGFINEVTSKYGDKMNANELVANFIEKNIADEKFIKSIIKYNSNFAYRVLSNINAMVNSDEKTKLLNAWSNALKEVQQENEETIKNSLEENVGYHYGSKEFDSNYKSEYLYRRGGRSTGAFGTGTYVFGNKQEPSKYSYNDGTNTEHMIDLNDYNMFKPKNSDEGFELHDYFKKLDDNYTDVDSKAWTIDEYNNVYNNVLNQLNQNPNEFLDENQLKEISGELSTIAEDKDIKEIIEQATTNDDVLAENLAYEIEKTLNFDDNWNSSIKYMSNRQEINDNLERIADILGTDTNSLRNIVFDSMRSAKEDISNDMMSRTDSVGTRIMKALGYEGIDVRGIKGLDNSTYGSVIYDLKPETVLYSLEDNDLHKKNIEQYGAFEKGEKAVRDVEISKETKKGKTARGARTVAEAKAVSDRFAEKIQKESDIGTFTYQDETLAKMRSRNEKKIAEVGYELSVQKYLKDTTLKRAKNVVVTGELLMQQALQRGHTEEAMRIGQKLVIDEALAGQSVVSARIFKTLSPEMQLITVEKQIKSIQEALNEEYGDKAPKLKVDEKLITELNNAKTDEEKMKAFEKIGENIADQLPSSLADKVNAWRYLAMLGNPRTHIRNILGNTTFAGLVDVKTAIQTGLEKGYADYAKKHGKEFTRQAGIYNFLSEKDTELYKEAIKDYEGHKTNEHKFNLEEIVNQKKNVFSNNNPVGKSLNWLIKKNGGALEFEDSLAMKRRYAMAMTGYLKVNNLNFQNATETQLYNARQYATNEALRATFNDANKLAKQISSIRENGPISAFFVDALIPFKNTPLNIIKRGAEYSPLGFVKGFYQLSKGEASANEVIDSFASGLTGTGVLLLGALLRSLGLIRISDDDKDRKKYFDEENGEQDYALVFNGNTYTIDWLDPIIVPVAMGASAYDAFSENGLSTDGLINMATGVADPIFETTMLSSLTDALTSYGTNPVEKIGDIVKSAVQSYILQFIPTLSGQIARTVDDTRRKTSPNDGFLDETLKKVLNKIPFASKLNEPYINKEGEEQKNEVGSAKTAMGQFAMRMFLNMASPGYYASNKIDEHDEELYRLYDSTHEMSVFPSSNSDKTVDYGSTSYKMNDKEYTSFYKDRYGKESELVNEFIDSSEYQDLSDEERVEVINSLRGYAGDYAKEQFLKSKGITMEDSEYQGYKDAVDSDVSLYNYVVIKNYYNDLKGDDKKSDFLDYLDEKGYDENTKQFMYGKEYGKSKVYGYIEDLNYDDELKNNIYEVMANTEPDYDENGDTISNSKAEKLKAKYQELGVYDDIVKYCQENLESKYTSFGLTKTVVEGTTKSSSKKSSSSSKTTPTISTKSSTSKTSNTSSSNSNTYLSSYKKVFGSTSNGSSSTGSSTFSNNGTAVRCYNCGNTVVPINGKCPVCGVNL